MGIKVKTPKFRANYAFVFKTKAVEKDDGSTKNVYSVLMAFEKGADLSALKNAAKEALKEKGMDPEVVTKHPKFKSPFKDQATMVDDDGELRPGMVPGAIFVNASNEIRPLVVDANVQEIIDPRDFYSGCYAVASLEAWAYDNKFGKGVSFNLLGLQKVADGEPLGGQGLRASTEDFAPIEGAGESTGGNSADPFA